MEKSYLFYDIETTGFNPVFQQVCQFSAIRTDIEFNELERLNIFVKLLPDDDKKQIKEAVKEMIDESKLKY